MRRGDRVIGILLGLLIGAAVVVLFVFGGPGQSLDAPSIGSGETTALER